MRPKHIPVRTCIACRTPGDKRGLLRIARQPDGAVIFDPTGKANGRGAYVCATAACIAQARKQKRLERSLKTDIPSALFDTLTAQVAPDPPATAVPTDPPSSRPA